MNKHILRHRINVTIYSVTSQEGSAHITPEIGYYGYTLFLCFSGFIMVPINDF